MFVLIDLLNNFLDMLIILVIFPILKDVINKTTAFKLMIVTEVLTYSTFVLQVLQGLEAATYCVEDMDEWLGIFNVKLRHMREDIASVNPNFDSISDCTYVVSLLDLS